MPRMPRVLALLAAVAATAALLAAAPAASAQSDGLRARGSVGQAYVVGAQRGERLSLLDARGSTVRTGRADRLGSRIWRELRPGAGYRVRAGGELTAPFRVLRGGDHPRDAFYERKRLRRGLNYVTMRDGVELAMTVRLPPGKTLEDGPFPTVVEYSGYQVAAPGDLLSQITAGLSGRPTEPNPLVPATSTVVGSVLGPLLDFAVVSVQMRGSGCSGGAFDLFDLPTTYDGYDAIESVAAQPWVKGGRVGMIGISFSGITQLFTGGTRPPHLAAIAPLSVTDDLYRATGYPGGIRNVGFARSWVAERMRDARPAPQGGQPYARALVRRGDEHCRDNQRLRLQTQDAVELQERTGYRDPSLFEHRSPATWMARIEAPTFLVGQFQDEQTGGHFVRSLDLLKGDDVWITLQNGVHVDSLGPDTVTRWVEFLKLHVAREVPRIPDAIIGLTGPFYRALADAPAAPVRQSRFAGTTSVAAARAEFARDPRVRILMDNGASAAGPGSIGATWELGFDAWLPREVRATTWGMGARGRLVGGAAGTRLPRGTATYRADPGARPQQTLRGESAGDDAWLAQPPYDWRPVPGRSGTGFVTEPLERDVVIAGPSSADLRVRSTARDTDLQVTLTEVRPDGRETYVQSGWLRASHRALDRRRTSALQPFPTHLARDARPLPRGRAALVRVPIYPVAHAFRAGSRIRVTVTAPGGDRAIWRFGSVDDGSTRNTLLLGGRSGSRLVLPVVAGADAKGTPRPAPTALRGQPSRTYAPAANGG